MCFAGDQKKGRRCEAVVTVTFQKWCTRPFKQDLQGIRGYGNKSFQMKRTKNNREKIVMTSHRILKRICCLQQEWVEGWTEGNEKKQKWPRIQLLFPSTFDVPEELFLFLIPHKIHLPDMNRLYWKCPGVQINVSLCPEVVRAFGTR